MDSDQQDETASQPLTSVTTLTFRYAKTMPECPHWYAVRSPENEAEYVRMFEAVRANGIYQRWRGRRRQYFYAGDGYKYWVMTNKVEFSRIINRTRVDEPTAQPDPVYECPRCGKVSYNPNDIAERYCGRCHVFESP